MTYTTQGITIDQVTAVAQIVLKNKMAFGNRVQRQFDSSFGEVGAKIGDTLRLRVPPRFQVTNGPAPATQVAQETHMPVAAQNQQNILLSFTTKDLALSIDDFRKRFIEPQMTALAATIDATGTAVVTSGATITNSGYSPANYAGTYVGFAGLVTAGGYSANGQPISWTGAALGSQAGSGYGASANAQIPFYNAQARLDEQSAPDDERYVVLSPAAAAATQPNLTTLFNARSEIDEIIMRGKLGDLAGFQFFSSQSVQAFTSGNWTNSGAATNVASATANSGSITLQGVGNNANIAAGDQFVVAGVYPVNPVNYIPQTTSLQVFTANAAATANATGVVTLSVYPPLANASAGAQQLVSAVPAPGAQVSFLSWNQQHIYTGQLRLQQGPSIVFVVAPLEDVTGEGAACSVMTDPDDGMSVRLDSSVPGSN